MRGCYSDRSWLLAEVHAAFAKTLMRSANSSVNIEKPVVTLQLIDEAFVSLEYVEPNADSTLALLGI